MFWTVCFINWDAIPAVATVKVQSNPPVDRFATDSFEKGVQRQIKAVPVASNSKSQREAIHIVSIYIYINRGLVYSQKNRNM